MIRALRRRHRVVVPALAIVVAAVAVVALARRPAPPPAVERLPGAAQPSFADVDLPRVESTAPVAVYWSNDSDPSSLGDDARLLGVVRASSRTRYPVPLDLAGAGALKLWDLERHRVIEVVRLGGEAETWR